MTKIKFYSALLVTAAINYPAKWLLVPVILVLGTLATSMLFKIYEVSEFIPPLINALFAGPTPIQLPLVLVSYTLLIFSTGLLFKRIAFLAAVKLFNRHNTTLVP